MSPAVVELAVPARGEPTDPQRWLAEIAATLEQGQPFGLVLDYGVSVAKLGAVGKRTEQEWLRCHGARLRALCVGVAVVHHAGGARSQLERVVGTGLAERWFGCPCVAVAERDEALAWLAGLVAVSR